MSAQLPDLDRLERVAGAASAVRWEVEGHSHLAPGCRCLSCHDESTVWQLSSMLGCDDVPGEGERCDAVGFNYADACFIEAASPAVVLVLVERVRQLEAG